MENGPFSCQRLPVYCSVSSRVLPLRFSLTMYPIVMIEVIVMFPLALDDQYTAMPWDALDAVVFDVGNVLLTFNGAAFLRACFPDNSVLQNRLQQKIFHSPYWAALDHGLLTNQDAAEAMAGHDTDLLPSIRQVLDAWPSLMEPIQEGIDALHVCKAHGKKIYILSNFHDGPFTWVSHHHNFFDLADGFVISARVKLCKPDPMIYRHLTDTFRLEPGRTLFIDDTPANVEAAMHAGWQGLCLNAKGKLSAFIGQ